MEIKKSKKVDVIGSVYKIPLKNTSVDVVTMFILLEHLREPLKGLKECYRVLKKGGYLALTTVQYWHEHHHRSDYYRYTRHGPAIPIGEGGFFHCRYVVDERSTTCLVSHDRNQTAGFMADNV